MKRILSLLLALLMTVSVCGMSASAVATRLEAGNSMSSAAAIPNFGVDYVSSLDAANEVDWFKFVTVSSEAFYTITIRNNNCKTIHYCVYDPNMKQQAANSWIYANGSKSSNLKLEKNTVYYIKIEDSDKANGMYELCVSYRQDTIRDTKDASFGFSLKQTVIQSIDGVGDRDWYHFTTTNQVAFYTIRLRNNSCGSLAFYLYDTNMNLKTSQNWIYSNKEKSSNIKLETNTTYYIRIEDGDNVVGNYELYVDYKTDTVGDTMNNAADLSLNQTLIGSMDGADDVDWYRFKTAAVAAKYVVTLKNNNCGSLYFALYDENNNQKANQNWIYANGSKKSEVELEASKVYYIKVDDESNAIGMYELSVTTNAVVQPKVLDSIRLVSQPNKTMYTLGEAFQKTGMVVRATYTDGTTYDPTNFTVSGFDAYRTGEQTLTVSYTEGSVTKTCTTRVTVLQKAEKALSAISVRSLPYKTEYKYGETLNTAGLSILASYTDGSSAVVSGLNVSGFDAYRTGTQTLTVTYSEGGITRTTTFTVKVTPAAPAQKTLNSIVIVFTPNKTTYEVGEKLNTTGMLVNGNYSDGSVEEITDYTVTGFDSATAGTKTVTVTATVNGVTRSADFTVTIKEKKKSVDVQQVLQKILDIFKTLWTPFTKLLKLFIDFIKIILSSTRAAASV